MNNLLFVTIFLTLFKNSYINFYCVYMQQKSRFVIHLSPLLSLLVPFNTNLFVYFHFKLNRKNAIYD